MKIFCCVMLVTTCLFSSLAMAEEMTGRQVMEEQIKRHTVQSETTVDVMLLVDSKDRKETRTLKSYYKDLGGGETRTLVVFEEPATVKGTAMLTWEHKNGESDQWLYLPSQKKLQRIAQGSKKSYFMGTDLTYEDLEPEQMMNFTYTMLDPETVDGNECYVIESVPSDKEKLKKSGYSKRTLWVRKDIFFTVKVEFYDQRGRLIKTQTNLDAENIGGTVWRAKKALMDNHKRKHKTLTAVKSDDTNVELDDAIFTERYLTSEKHVQ
ncbi:outer membrane lipoprotein-sorting protein [Candidatus Latescibacterota bacterium]